LNSRCSLGGFLGFFSVFGTISSGKFKNPLKYSIPSFYFECELTFKSKNEYKIK
jgi:hypothetical protein